MFDAMFIGLSGMSAYSNGLRQISNNITNLNSTGFRASTVVFNDLFRSGASGGLSFTGGDAGAGNGVQLSDLRLDFSQGELRQSNRDLDLALEGNGFLVLEKNGGYFYARTGNFEIDDDGYIILSGTEYRLTVLDGDGNAVSLSVDDHRVNPPEATTTIKFSDNLSSTSDGTTLSNLLVFDAAGSSDGWQVKIESEDTAPAGEWSVTVTNGAGVEIGSQTLRFINGIVDSETEKLTFTDEDAGRNVVFDFSENVTSFSSGSISTLRSVDIDGFGIGEITTLQVNEEGILEINYSNEQKRELGAVTIADFRDPQALEQRSGGLFVYENSTGREFLASESDKVGRVLSRRLEASNVDLSQQFGDLILVQRGYQASSQIVSVSNDMIQQLFGIRGQG